MRQAQSQHPSTDRCGRSSGFTLIELAVVLMLFGILVSSGLVGFAHISQKIKTDATQEKIDLAFNALSSYAQRYKRLPCPADPDGNGRERLNGNCFVTASASVLYTDMQGVLPWRELGIPEAMVRDGWGRYITYKPAPQLTVNYLSPEMQENKSADADKTEIHDACRSPLWYATRLEGSDVRHYHADREKALFCCSTAPRSGYLGGPLPGGWRDQAVMAAGVLTNAAANTLNAGSVVPVNIPLQSTNAWMDGVDNKGNLINNADGQPMGGLFAKPDHGQTADDSPDAPLNRAMGQAVTLISHGGNGLLSYLRGQNGNIRLQANFDSGSGITGGGDIAANEKLNIWPPQVAAATTYHPKVSDAVYDPFSMRSGASDDRAAFLQTDQLFSRIGAASCLRPANYRQFDDICVPDTYDDVIYLLDTSGSMGSNFDPNCKKNCKTRIDIAKVVLKKVLRQHLEREMRDDKDFDKVGYSGFNNDNPEYKDDSAFFPQLFAEGDMNNDGKINAADDFNGDGIIGVSDPEDLERALKLYNKGSADVTGDGKIDNDDLIEARVSYAVNKMNNKINKIEAGGCTPVIESTKQMANIVINSAIDKTCQSLVAQKEDVSSIGPCAAVQSEYNKLVTKEGADTAAEIFQAKYNPETLTDKDGDGNYDIEPNAVVLLSDGGDTCSSGVNIAKDGLVGSYEKASAQILKMQDNYNNIFKKFKLNKKINIHIADVVGNEGLESLKDNTGGKYSRSSDVDEVLKQLEFWGGTCPTSDS